ncbi:MAG: glycosyltransferase family 2 protein [Candidatus Margulisbacteria bacterium]|nr:glycosyltransferase family 2 protein [Candidatus Margulisiibacteriota bacterium]
MPVKTKKTVSKKDKRNPAKISAAARRAKVRARRRRGGKLPTLSLCMIVRNAAANLALCLDSVKNVVDEIIIVDTGSTDNTVAIAKKYTDKIYFYKWRDDFARARNESIKYATKDWVLVLDDDEALTRQSARTIKKFLAGGPVEKNVYTAWIYNCGRADAEKEIWQKQPFNGIDVHTHGRLFRNHRKIKFKKALHEHISEKDGGTIYNSNVRVLHYGYEDANRNNRYLRNFNIAEKALRKKPEDVVNQFNYTRAYSCLETCTDRALIENMDRTIELYIKGKKQLGLIPLSYIYTNFVALLIKQELYVQAEKYCYAWLSRLQDGYDLRPYLTLGKVLLLEQKTPDAYKMLDLVYTKSRNGLAFCTAEELGKFQAELHFYLGAACVIKGEYRRALRLLRVVQKNNIFGGHALKNLLAAAQKGLVRAA